MDIIQQIWMRWKSDRTPLKSACKDVDKEQKRETFSKYSHLSEFLKRKKLLNVEKTLDKLGLNNLIDAIPNEGEKKRVRSMPMKKQREYFEETIQRFEESSDLLCRESFLFEYLFYDNSGLLKPPQPVYQDSPKFETWRTNPTVLQLQLSNEKNARNQIPTNPTHVVHELTDPEILKGEEATIFKVTVKQFHMWSTAINFFISKGCLVSINSDCISVC
jgi:hypothetical protein